MLLTCDLPTGSLSQLPATPDYHRYQLELFADFFTVLVSLHSMRPGDIYSESLNLHEN